MRKLVVSALAALMAAGPVLALAGPAEAGGDRRRHHYRHHHRGGGDDVAIAAIAGIAGLAIGAAIADGNRGSRHYYGGRSSYRTGYAYDPHYDSYYGGYYPRGRRICVTRERVWDPYIGRHVRIQREYPC